MQVTTPSHGVALGVYLLTAVLGLLHLTDLAAAKVLAEWIGTGPANLWAMAMMVGGGLAFIAAVTARPSNIVRNLLLELCGCVAMVGTYLLYLASLLRGYELTNALTTKTMGLAIALGAALRVGQIVRERRRVRAALDHPLPASPSPLAEPKQ